MKHLNEDKIVCFDVDDTLVMWAAPAGNVPIIDQLDGSTVNLRPHSKHIQKLKGYARSGWYVIVWSAGGHLWAKSVVESLKLQDYVDMVMSKPSICYDDLPVGEGIAPRRYFSPPREVDNE